MKKEQSTKTAASNSPVEKDAGANTVPNPVEEKNANGLQNLSEYLHNHHQVLEHPVAVHFFGNRHDIINYPVHHCDLIIPPPKAIG
ncbi:MAG: hypothetical protein ABIU63_12060 [Chitinophagaceae bacterium]